MANEHSPARVVVGVLASVLIAFCAWSAFRYSQGLDPLAFLGSDALRTVESSDAAAISVGADQAATARAKSDSTTAGGKKDSAAASSKKDASDKSTTAGGSASAGSARSGSHSGGSGGSGSGSASGSGSGSHVGSSESKSIVVSVTVDGSAAGAGSSSANIRLSRGATAYDAIAACGVSFNAKSTSFGMYVSSIGGLAEKEHGAMSGWVYAVNGHEPNTACSNYELHDGDSLVWTYVNVTE